MKILVVEDEDALREGLVDLLTDAGHEVRDARDGEEAIALSKTEALDLIVLDWMLPGLDGLAACKKIRRIKPALPILMLTARGQDEDKILGLDEGADDYMTKPFSPHELLARVRAFERRAKRIPSEPEIIVCGDYRFDFENAMVYRGKEKLMLTPLEIGMLRWLYRSRSRAVSRSELLDQIWGMKSNTETRAVDVAIAALRKKLEVDPQNPRLIVTVKNLGYMWGGDSS